MAKKTRNYLALDLGAESGRGIVARFDGSRITLQEVYRFEHTMLRYQGTLRWDALAIARHLELALAAAVDDTRGDLVSLAVDTWGVDYVLLDRNDDLLSYPYHYRDPRNDVAMPAAFAKVPREKIFKSTGLQFLPFNTVYQLYAEVMLRSGALEAARSMLFMPDFLSYTLGGDKTCEYTIASTSQMLDARKRTWDLALLKRLGIPARILQPLVEPGTVAGKVRADTAERTGAPRKLKIIAAGRHDTASAVAAVPAEGEGWAYLSSGTWSLLGAEVPAPIINDDVYRLEFTNEGGLNGTIRLLRNIMGLWIVQELRRAWTDRQGNAPNYAELTAEAAQASDGGPLINVSWGPFGKPEGMPSKIETFCRRTRQAPPQTRGAFVRCALESLALAYRQTLEDLDRIQGRRTERLHIVGGGSKNELLNQLTADASGREVLAGPDEATAMGNVLAQMLADGQINSLAEGREIIRASTTLKRFQPRAPERWEESYGRYRRLRERSVSERL